MGIGALGNASVIPQASLSGNEERVNSIGAGNVKALYGDSSKTGMLSAHISRMNGFYANVKTTVDQAKSDIS